MLTCLMEGNEIALWPADQKKRHHDDLASGIKFSPPIASSMLGKTDPILYKRIQEKLIPHPYIAVTKIHPLLPAFHKVLIFLDLIFTVL